MILGINGIIAGKGVASIDADAQAFITAASITDTTQQSAINTLVNDLKSANIWSKMKAIYPFVGGSATSHKFNLKDPRDLDTAYRLTFSGGGTHDSNGYTGNASNSCADTKMLPSSALTLWNTHLSYYSRTTTLETSNIEMGSYDGTSYDLFALVLPRSTGRATSLQYDQSSDPNMAFATGLTSSTGLWLGNRTSNVGNTHKLFRNGSVIGTASASAGGFSNFSIYINALHNANNANVFSSGKNCAFASIGDGLTDAEATAFYNAVQTFNTTLGRQVGVPIVADSDAQAFLNAAVITDTTQANAINTLVTDLKSANIWSKMKAIYPFVGGTASSHKFNLKDPRDLDAAFRLVFNGGWTHSSTGALPNGTNAYANTYLIPSNVQILDSNGFGFYTPSLNTTASTDVVPMGSYTSAEKSSTMGYINNNTKITSRLNYYIITSSTIVPTGLLSTQKTSGILTTLYKNGTNIGSGNSSGFLSIYPFYFGTANVEGTPYSAGYVNHQFRLVYISDGLDSTDMTAFYTAVQAYQTSLSRQV